MFATGEETILGIDRQPVNANELLASGASGNEIDGRPWLLDCREVSRLLGIGRTKAYQMMTRTELPLVRIGRSVRVPRAALSTWISAKLVTGPEDEIRDGLGREHAGSAQIPGSNPRPPTIVRTLLGAGDDRQPDRAFNRFRGIAASKAVRTLPGSSGDISDACACII